MFTLLENLFIRGAIIQASLNPNRDTQFYHRSSQRSFKFALWSLLLRVFLIKSCKIPSTPIHGFYLILHRFTHRCSSRKRTNGRKKSSSMSRRQSSYVDPSASEANGSVSKYHQQQHHAASSSSSSSTASGRSEDVGPTLPTHYGSDHQGGASQQDDSGTEESPVYILTSAKGDRSYKLRDSRSVFSCFTWVVIGALRFFNQQSIIFTRRVKKHGSKRNQLRFIQPFSFSLSFFSFSVF